MLPVLALITFMIPQYAVEVLEQSKESAEVEFLIVDLKDPVWQIRMQQKH